MYICCYPSVAVMGQPDLLAENVDELIYGDECEILEEVGAYAKIRTDYGYEGYLEHDTDNALADISTESPVSGTALPFDADFLEAVSANSWEIGAQATFEGRRTGGGLW